MAKAGLLIQAQNTNANTLRRHQQVPLTDCLVRSLSHPLAPLLSPTEPVQDLFRRHNAASRSSILLNPKHKRRTGSALGGGARGRDKSICWSRSTSSKFKCSQEKEFSRRDAAYGALELATFAPFQPTFAILFL